MKVTVMVLPGLGEAGERTGVKLNLPEGAKVSDAIAQMRDAQLEHGSVFLRSQRVSENQELKEGDVLYIFRPIAGG